MAVGRITGPLLKANLVRQGVNLAFETDLIYLDVINSRVGIKTASPQYDLDVAGTTRTTNLEVTTQADLATFRFLNDTLSSSSGTINLLPQGTNPVVYQGTALIGDLQLTGNTISSTGINEDLTFQANGTGKINFNSDVLITGNLHATGTITADGGSITLGDATTDNVVFGGEVDSNIIPNISNTYNLGSSTQRWGSVYTHNLTVTSLTADIFYTNTFQLSGIDISGNTLSTRTPNTNISFTTSGTGGIVIGNFKFKDNSITNISQDAVTTFTETGSGYVQFAGTNGVVIPVGNGTTERPTLYETGMIRFNTDQQLVEVFNGTGWGSIAGTATGVTASTAQDIGVQMVLTLG